MLKLYAIEEADNLLDTEEINMNKCEFMHRFRNLYGPMHLFTHDS